MKKANITIEPSTTTGDYALYINGNYAGTYPKCIINIKLRAWHMPEIEL